MFSLPATETLRGCARASWAGWSLHMKFSTAWQLRVCVRCMFMLQRLHRVWKCSLFSPFNTKAASIIQQHIAEHNSTHCNPFSLQPSLQISSVFIRLLLDCFYAPILFLFPLPQSLTPAHFLSLFSCHVSPLKAEKLSNLSHFPAFISVYFSSSPLFSLLSVFYQAFLGRLYVHSLPLFFSFLIFTLEGLERRLWRGGKGVAAHTAALYCVVLILTCPFHWTHTHTHITSQAK